jgi:hypothetical protein
LGTIVRKIVGDRRTEPLESERARAGMPRLTSARRFVVRTVRRTLTKRGLSLVRAVPYMRLPLPRDCDDETAETIIAVSPYTLTSPDRVMGLCLAVRYLVASRIEGDIVECGVWRGGSIMAIARTLLSLGVTDRDIYMYDTFTDMPEPTAEDEIDLGGRTWSDLKDEYAASGDDVHSYLPFAEVRRLIEATGYPPERLHFVQGLVEDTIPEHAPERIALCRLDTDFYASTLHELRHLYPRIAPGGVLLIDDYSSFVGAKRAVDEYFTETDSPILLQRLDWAGRMGVVPGAGSGNGSRPTFT